MSFDPKTGDVVLTSRGLIGCIKYLGPLPGGSESTYFGVKLGEGTGDSDGTYNGVMYFKCEKNKGIFITRADVKRILTPQSLLDKIIVLNKQNKTLRANNAALRDQLTLTTQDSSKFNAGDSEKVEQQQLDPAAWLQREVGKGWYCTWDDFFYRYSNDPKNSVPEPRMRDIYSKQKSAFDQIKSVSPHTRIVYTVCASPRDNLLASGSDDKTIRLWRKDTTPNGCRCIAKISMRSCINALTISPDGNLLAAALDSGWIELWDLQTGKNIGSLEGQTTSEVWTICFSPDGSNIISGALDRAVRIWEVKERECRWALRGHDEWVNGVAVSSDGQHIISGSGDKTVRVWDTKKMSCLHSFIGHGDFVRSVCVAEDCDRVISASDDCSLRVWSIRQGRPLNTLKGHKKGIYSVSSGKGSQVASASRDATVKIWNLDGDNKPCIKTFNRHRGDVNSCTIFGNGRYVASGSDDKSVIVHSIT